MHVAATGSIWHKDCDRATPNVRPAQKQGTEGAGDGMLGYQLIETRGRQTVAHPTEFGFNSESGESH